MQLTCFPAAVCGKTALPPSKSHAVRLIAAGLMSASPLKIISLPRCDDVAAALSCAEAMGAQLRDDVLFPPASFPEKSVLNCRDSGCAMRFFTAIAAFAGGSHRIYGSRTLMSRPTDALLRALTDAGAKLSFDGNALIAEGAVSAGRIEVDCSLSSQYLSALLMAAPLARKPLEIVAKNTVSRDYAEMTVSVMKTFGVRIETDGDVYRVPAGGYVSPGSARVDPDASAAAVLAAAAAIAGEVSLTGAVFSLPQADARIFGMLKAAGAYVTEDGGTLTVKKNVLDEIEVDCDLTPDLAPVAAVLGAFARKGAHIFNAARLSGKESDRVKAIVEMINSLGGRAEVRHGCIEVAGTGLKGGKVLSFGDHRIAMAAAVAAVGCAHGVTLDDADCVNKSWPSFWEDYAAIGGKFRRDRAEKSL